IEMPSSGVCVLATSASAAYAGFSDFAVSLWIGSNEPSASLPFAFASYVPTGGNRSWGVCGYRPSAGVQTLSLIVSATGGSSVSHPAPIDYSDFVAGWNHVAWSRTGTTLTAYL